MPGTRTLLIALALCSLPTAAHAVEMPALFGRKRPDPTRVRVLADLLRTETDEKRCKSAVAELADADPRAHPDVIPALLAALRKDAAGVRAAAAEVIGKFKTTFPLAGSALEKVAETDPDPAVRSAAKQALWDYHLNGYRSTKSVEAASSQTAEPPIAAPLRPRAVRAVAPMPTPLRTAVAAVPASSLPAVTSVPVPQRVAPAGGPRVSTALPLDGLNSPRRLLSLPQRPSLPTEPPIAKRSPKWTPPPATASEPPILVRRPDLGTFGEPTRVLFELPAIVPGPTAVKPAGK
ncbi:hypothetical protein : : HEAT_2 [Gemmataceae bacterium]|nr:hypothetical protein : : HEAT_2 [Gemmataceae bacterium]VTT98005.1 hypothetical protein : : HEAT_2 [Gemmataceae bacterium]